MRNVTSTMIAVAREARKSGQSMWPIPLDKIDELAEYLQRVDRLVIASEVVRARFEGYRRGESTTLSGDDIEALDRLDYALREVQS